MAIADQPLISIVIATYNASQFIDRTLESIASQDLEGDIVEIVMVDGASTDGTVDRARASELPIVIRSQPDDGIYDAMNIGVEMASGRWVQFLNAGDTYTSTHSLSKVARVLSQLDPIEVGWVVGAAQNLQGGSGPARPIENVPYKRRLHLFGLQPHCHQACWFAREQFQSFGGHRLDMGMVADYDLIAQFGSLHQPVSLTDVVIDYLGGGVSEVSAGQIAERLHQARSLRFQLGPVGRSVDHGVSRSIGLFNGARVRAGAIWQRFRHALGG